MTTNLSTGHERLNLLMRTKVANTMAFLQGERALTYVVSSLLLMALALRVAVAITLPPRYFFPDAKDYVNAAENLIQTHTYGRVAGVPGASPSPGYPLFLALVYLLLGHSILAVRLSQAILDTLTCLLVFFLAKKVYDRKVAIVSLLAVALYPVAIAWSAFHLSETLYTFLVAVFFLCLVKSFDSPTSLNIFLGGMTFTLALLTRELLVLFPLFIFAALIWTKFKLKQIGKYVVIFSLGVAVVLAPWVVRNYLSLHRFVLVTDRTGSLQYDVTGYVASSNAERAQRDERQRRLEEILSGARGLNDTTYNEVLNFDFMSQHPRLYLKMIYVRFQTLWFHPDGLDRLPSWPLKAAYVFGQLVFLGLGCFGMFLAIRERNKLTYPLILVFPYVTVVILALLRPQPRYKMPFLPYMFIFAVSGLCSIWAALRRSCMGRSCGPQ